MSSVAVVVAVGVGGLNLLLLEVFLALTRGFKTSWYLLAFLHSAVGNGDFEFAAVNSSFQGTADDKDGVD